VSLLNDEIVPKRLELLRELVPRATTIAILLNPDNRNHPSYAVALDSVARAGGQKVLVLGARTDPDFEPAFATLVERRADALVVAADPFFDSRREQIVGLAARYAVPTIFQWREFVQAGGLADAHRLQGVYSGRLLKGAKPADLPVVQPTKFELFVNLKTAKALGFDIPTTVLARADEVIE
jgi:putative ABC transport system substrate-binding protein